MVARRKNKLDNPQLGGAITTEATLRDGTIVTVKRR